MELRLLPLRTVLFPGQPLPLRIVEERYRLLIAECMEAREPLGVVLTRRRVEAGGSPAPHSLGTTAKIRSVRQRPGDELRLQTAGQRRFRIIDLHHDRPYPWASVEYPVDEPAEVPDAVLEQAREGLATLVRLRLTASGAYMRETAAPQSASALADAIGGLMHAPPGALQQLLATMNVRRRLERATEMLEGAIRVAHRDTRQALERRYGDQAALN